MADKKPDFMSVKKGCTTYHHYFDWVLNSVRTYHSVLDVNFVPPCQSCITFNSNKIILKSISVNPLQSMQRVRHLSATTRS